MPSSCKPFLYLASASPRRREILKKAGIRFKRVFSSYQEKAIPHLGPSRLVIFHARQKALHAKAPASGLVLAADTIVCCRGKIFGKPKDKREAFERLWFLSGRAHFVYTGIALLDLKTGRMKLAYEKTKVFIRRLSRPEIEKYFMKVNPLDKAGAYAIQMKPKIVEQIKGSYSNVVGLPLEKLKKILQTAGFRPQARSRK